MSRRFNVLAIMVGALVFIAFQNCSKFDANDIAEQQSSLFSVNKESGDEYTISAQYYWARTILQRVASVNLGPDHPTTQAVMQQIEQGSARGAVLAATQATNYYDVTLREIAAPMSNREENISEPLNDFIATFIGIVRDDLDTKLMLTGDFFYKGDSSVSSAQDLETDIIKSNRHYASFEASGMDISPNLSKVDNQSVMTQSGGVKILADSAGLLTSRAFMKAHAFKGTNRRLVEHSFKEFLCSPITSWADIDNPDDHITKDVDRFPVGDNAIFQDTCKACHAAMDAFRPAFGHVDFDVDPANDQFAFMKHKFTTDFDPDPVDPGGQIIVPSNQVLVPAKMRRNFDIYPPGDVVTDEKWVNYNVGPDNMKRFGWRSPAEGEGLKDFGELLSKSRAFSRCMAKKVYKQVCRKNLPLVDDPVIEELADYFEKVKYNFRELTVQAAIRPDCFGLDISQWDRGGEL